MPTFFFFCTRRAGLAAVFFAVSGMVEGCAKEAKVAVMPVIDENNRKREYRGEEEEEKKGGGGGRETR